MIFSATGSGAGVAPAFGGGGAFVPGGAVALPSASTTIRCGGVALLPGGAVGAWYVNRKRPLPTFAPRSSSSVIVEFGASGAAVKSAVPLSEPATLPRPCRRAASTEASNSAVTPVGSGSVVVVPVVANFPATSGTTTSVVTT